MVLKFSFLSRKIMIVIIQYEFFQFSQINNTKYEKIIIKFNSIVIINTFLCTYLQISPSYPFHHYHNEILLSLHDKYSTCKITYILIILFNFN